MGWGRVVAYHFAPRTDFGMPLPLPTDLILEDVGLLRLVIRDTVIIVEELDIAWKARHFDWCVHPIEPTY